MGRGQKKTQGQHPCGGRGLMPADGPEEETCSEFPTNHLNLWGVWTSDVNRPKSLFSNLKRTMDPVSVVLRSKRGITGKHAVQSCSVNVDRDPGCQG